MVLRHLDKSWIRALEQTGALLQPDPKWNDATPNAFAFGSWTSSRTIRSMSGDNATLPTATGYNRVVTARTILSWRNQAITLIDLVPSGCLASAMAVTLQHA